MITLTFTPLRETKGTWRFEEVLPSEYADPKIGTLYVRKGALGDMGYEPGDNLTVTVTVDGNAVTKPSTRKPRSRR